jgi:hypothetical protein
MSVTVQEQRQRWRIGFPSPAIRLLRAAREVQRGCVGHLAENSRTARAPVFAKCQRDVVQRNTPGLTISLELVRR